ncbi:MAG: EAL domain-containing protein [Campylobacterota bacterium]|nr:EAL domain-containing protein [Campylobacterota bacterium]
MKNEKFELLKEQCKDMTILYVEDEKDVSDIIADILSNIFKEVITASNGKEGLERIDQYNNFDIIITDVNMPIKNGLDMIKEIRKFDDDIPILIISANKNTDYFMDMIRYGVDGYLLKPLEYEQFISTLLKAAQKIVLRKQNDIYKYNLEKKVKEKTSQLEHKYYTDELTGLNNRYSLLKDIKELNAKKLMLIDINKFSALNDVYGSEAGDDILKIITNKLSQIVIQGCVLYRVSADQFAFLSHNEYNHKTCIDFIDIITDMFSGSDIFINVDNTQIEINISATISIAKDINNNHLLECADTALHYAKETNQPYVIYSQDLESKMNHQKRFDAVKLVKKALEEDRLVPFFQPIIKDEGITYECLVRIIDEDGKIISPSMFVDEIKNTPYYTKLTKRMIEKSFAFFSNKKNSLSINLSFEDISNAQLIEYIKEQLDKYNLHSQLILEILESESINNFDVVKHFIHEMKSLGVRIAIDDFGSGYSNFSYLLELEPDFIKIDGSIIKNIAIDNKSYTIAKTIVNFSKELGIKTIGEFIHNEAVLNKVVDLGIEGKQGYFLGEPKPNI